MIRMTLDCVRPTQSSVIQIIHRNVDLKCLFQFYQNVCYYRYTYASFIHISQSSVETHLQCGGIYNNQIIANCVQSECVSERILKISQ